MNIDIEYWIGNDMKFGAKSSVNQGKYKFSVNKEVFKSIDNAIYTLLEGKLDENRKIREEFYKIVSLGEEYNKKRAKVFSQIILINASDIVINHELGHIMNGHLAYIDSKNIGEASFLFMNCEKNEIQPMESQVLEMDADAFAATRVMDKSIFDDNLKNINSLYPNLVKDKNHAFLLSTVSAVIVFSIQGLGRKRKKQGLEEVKYLPLRTRLYNYIQCSVNAYKHLESSELLRYDYKSLIPLLMEVESYINDYTKNVYSFENDEISTSNNLHELSDEYIVHCYKLNLLWTSKYREELLKYAYFNLAL